MNIFSNGDWLPLTFAGLMGIAILMYAILDGYDLGVGILMAWADDDEKDQMIASIGPFWDANETWLVLGVGLLLVAFPAAHGLVLTNLYLPVLVMLIGLILRGVSFDFRAKAPSQHKHRWNQRFFVGSLIATFAQGYMLGSYIMGFDHHIIDRGFAVLTGFCMIAAYTLVGSAWLILKTDGALQTKAVGWARYALRGTIIAIGLISVSTPLVSGRIFDKWFDMPNLIFLAPIPLVTLALMWLLAHTLKSLPSEDDKGCARPMLITIGIFVLFFIGLAYSFYPYVVPEQLTIVGAASDAGSLKFILWGALVVMPCLMGYTALAYKIFHGKATALHYD